MKEYVFRIVSRAKEHPLNEKVIVELGFGEMHPLGMIAGLQSVVDILKILKTPEAVAEFMIRNSVLGKNLKLERK